MQSDTKKRLGILRGGAGENYNSSLKKGGEIILHINQNLGDKYKVSDILVDRDHVWYLNGFSVVPGDLIHKVDIVWNVSHPSLSNILNSLAIPHITSGSFSDALGSSREMLRQHMKKIGISMPRHVVLPVYQKDFDGPREKYTIKKAKEVFEKFSSPWIVKSFTPDVTMAIHLAKTFPELVDAIEDGVKHEKSILVEEFIAGKVASLHSMPYFRGEDMYTFPLGNSFGNFSNEEREKLINAAKSIHAHIGAHHYLKSDFILNTKGRVYLLQVESVPDLKPDSHFSQVVDLAGAKMQHVVEHILEQA